MGRKRRGSPSSIAFLDAMTCGLGAVILLYMIFNGAAAKRRDDGSANLARSASRLEEELLVSHAALVELRQTLSELRRKRLRAESLSHLMLRELELSKVELATFDQTRLSKREHLNRLQADLRSLEEDVKRLAASRPRDEVPGRDQRSFVGDGDRQYLTGLKVGGSRILILVDTSSSMLADSIVNVIRFRNLPEDEARQAKKWRQTVRTVDWLLTQVPVDSRVRIHAFAESVERLHEPEWIAARDTTVLDVVVEGLSARMPQGGTSLQRAFASIAEASPRPDNVILITDGLPTQGAKLGRTGTVTGKQRVKLFARALEALPGHVPVNTILLPMEGDPMAAASFWRLALGTGGSCISPTEDWP